MPYFAKIQKALEETLLWADLRKEQQAAVAPIVKDLEHAITKAQRRLVHMRPSSKTMKSEPEDLEAIRALRPKGPRRLTTKISFRELNAKIAGAFLGRAAGCTLGHPVEGWTVADMEQLARWAKTAFPPTDYWPVHPKPEEMKDYLRGNIRAVPVDDDIAYTLLGLLILEQYGQGFTTDHVAAAWKDYLTLAYTAERVALDNLQKGIPPSKAGEMNNPFQEWIGADIRSDPWAYAAPGFPERAAEFAYRDAYLSHRRNGIYGAMFFAAAISAAFVVEDPIEAIKIGLTEIPRACRLAHDIAWALKTAPTLKSWRDARAAVDKRFAGMHPVHTNNNACLTVFGLYLGQGNFTATIGVTVAMGLDNDCTAATAGSLLGAILGKNRIPDHWWKPFRNRVSTYLRNAESFSISDVIARFARVASSVISST